MGTIRLSLKHTILTPKLLSHGFNFAHCYAHRHWCPAVAGEHIHPHGWENQANLNVVVVVAVVVWLLNGLGLMDSIRGVRVGR